MRKYKKYHSSFVICMYEFVHACRCMDWNMGFVVAVFMNYIVSFLSQTILASSTVTNNPFQPSLNTTKGNCKIKNGAWRCCAMYHFRNGKCQECPKGTYRFIDDTECKKCFKGFYGRFCVQPCECKNDDCDPVEGTCNCERGDVECNKEDPKTKSRLLMVFDKNQKKDVVGERFVRLSFV